MDRPHPLYICCHVKTLLESIKPSYIILVSNLLNEPKISNAAAVETTFIVEADGKLKFGLYSEIIALESKSLTTKLIEAFFSAESFTREFMAAVY